MKLALGAIVLIGAMFPATAQAYVAPEKQDDMQRLGFTEQVTAGEEPLASKAGHCERGKIRSAIRDSGGNVQVMGWTSIGACVTANGQLRILGVGYGQGSSGHGWRQTLPLRAPFLSHGWLDHPMKYRSRAKYGWEYGVWNTPWYLQLTLIAVKRSATNIVFVRKARWF